MGAFDWATEKVDEVDKVTTLADLSPAENALEEIQTERFYDTLKSYYKYRDGDEAYTTRGKFVFDDMSNADLLEYFYHDRTWRNNQSVSMSMDLANVMGEEDPMRMQQFAYINTTYQNLPYFWNDPNRDFGDWLIDMGGALVLDPVNLVGFGVGGQAAKQAYKQSLKQALKGKIAKKVNERLILEAAEKAKGTALKSAIAKGALYEGGIGAGIGAFHDTLLQTTAIQSKVQDDFDLKRLGLNTAAGFGIGTLFGGTFAYGGFKLTTKSMTKNSFKNLNDIHNYGFDELKGGRLFSDLTIKKKPHQLYKNMNTKQINEVKQQNKVDHTSVDARIKSLRQTAKEGILPTDKPPKRPFNYTRISPEESFGVKIFIKNSVKEMSEDLDKAAPETTFKDIEASAEKWTNKPKELIALMKKEGIAGRELAAQILAHDKIWLKNADDMVKLSRMLDDESLDLVDENKILNELGEREALHKELSIVKKQVQKNVATALASMKIERQSKNIASLIVEPADLKLKVLKDKNIKLYWKEIAKLSENDDALEEALGSIRKVDSADLAAEFVNNNLLSSPDTHILNIASSLVQSQWKPLVMMIRAANLGVRGNARAVHVAREALQTYIHQWYYVMEAMGASWRSIKEGRPVLDSKQLKFDNNIRQGNLQRWANETVGGWFDVIPILGRPVNRYIWQPITAAVTFPLRILSAGDEFLKTMTFKARMAAIINSQIMQHNPDIIGKWGWKSYLPFKHKLGKDYFAKFKEYEKKFFQTNGKAISSQDINKTGRVLDDASALEVNDPLHYAREASYTQSAYSVNPKTGSKEGGLTGAVLRTTSHGKGKWLRVFGLHFINTPSNLLRWVFQHTPTPFTALTFGLVRTGRLQFQMKHMLAKGKDGKFLNPEAAAEAGARLQMGYLLWTAAIFSAVTGKVTGGGSRDWKANKQREADTGWQPYSWRTEDGRYISLNRLDPVFMPFMLAADMVDAMGDFLETNEDLPEEVENKYSELFAVYLMSLTRNLTSKFYTKNLLETADMLLGDGLAFSKDPAYKSAAMVARGFYKVIPLSGFLRYTNRVTDEYEREIWSMSDRLKAIYNPFTGKNAVMPKRNMFGEKINRKNGWLFGIGGKDGIWSSPFAMTKWKNPLVAKFFENREFDYKPPVKIDRYTNLNLKDIKNSKGQTAYDYMLEQKSKMKVYYPPMDKEATLKEIIEWEISNKTSKLYSYPKGIVAGDDWQQKHLLKIVHAFEREALKKVWEAFPIFNETLKKRNLYIKEEAEMALEEWLSAVNQ